MEEKQITHLKQPKESVYTCPKCGKNETNTEINLNTGQVLIICSNKTCHNVRSKSCVLACSASFLIKDDQKHVYLGERRRELNCSGMDAFWNSIELEDQFWALK